MVKASAMKLPNVNPPSNSILVVPHPNRVGRIVHQCGRNAQRQLVRFARRPPRYLRMAGLNRARNLIRRA
jgi:hypothetical protein